MDDTLRRLMFATIIGLGFRADAQIEISPPVHLSHVQGVVADRSGRPLAGAEVSLVREQAVVSKTTTDDSGRFALENTSGRYRLRISAKSYSPAGREVVIGPRFAIIFHRKQLYVMLGPGSCMDECSPIFTGKKEFDRAVLWNTGHYY